MNNTPENTPETGTYIDTIYTVTEAISSDPKHAQIIDSISEHYPVPNVQTPAENSDQLGASIVEHLFKLIQPHTVMVQGSHFWVDLACWNDDLPPGSTIRMYSRTDLMGTIRSYGVGIGDTVGVMALLQGSPTTRVVSPKCDKERLPLHPSGYQLIDGKPWFIQHDSSPLKAEKGDCSAILREICRMFGNEAPLLLGWLKGAYIRQLNYSAEARGQEAPFRKVASQTLAIVGDPGTGKTHVLLDIIFVGLLGTYANMPSTWLTGDSRFNDWALDSNIWVADDGVSLQTIQKRKHAATVLKNAGYASKLTIECKNKAVINMPYPCERIFVVNLQDYALRALPAYEENHDKYLFLHNCGPSGLMDDWDGDYDRMKKELSAAMPAFAHFLLHEYQLPDWTVTDTKRHTVADWGYMSPPVLKALAEQDEAGILMARLRKVYMDGALQERVHGRFHSQEALRAFMEAVERRPDCATSEKMGRLLAECQRRWPMLLERTVSKGYTSYKFRKHPDWENPLSLNTAGMSIAKPDPALLAAAGLPLPGDSPSQS